jgi:mannose-6-phosphate isomerase-like protein (cupin superfamily)|tara:strand:+ start:11740 stop:12084 length:345 start_codon:yes stop_codon:yes gene_type:complete
MKSDTIPKIVLQDKIDEIAGRPWHPIELAKVNDQVIRIALYKGEYHWHKHGKKSEFFFVVKGELTIQMKPPYSNITLREGEMAVVPRGIEHCPKSQVDTYVLMFEPFSLQSRGD